MTNLHFSKIISYTFFILKENVCTLLSPNQSLLLEYSYYHNCKDLQNIWNISSYLFRKDVKWIENLALALISLGWGQSLFQDTHINVQKKNWLMVLFFVLNKVLQSKKLLGYWHAAEKKWTKKHFKVLQKENYNVLSGLYPSKLHYRLKLLYRVIMFCFLILFMKRNHLCVLKISLNS